MSRVLKVGTPDDPHHGFTVVDDNWEPIAPIDRYLAYLEAIDRSPNTIRQHATALLLFWGYISARDVEWDQPTGMVDVLGSFMQWLSRGDATVIAINAVSIRSDSTIHSYLSAVYGFYTYHQRNGVTVLDNLVTADRRAPAYNTFLAGLSHGGRQRPLVQKRVPRRRVKNLTIAQSARIIDTQTRVRDQFLFTLLLTTGMRVGQALGLRHEDIDIKQRVIAIVARDNNLNFARAKGAVGEVLGQSAMTEELVALYTRYLQDELRDLDSDYVFVNLWAGNIGHPMTYSTVNELVRRTRAQVGFQFTAHQFRHTFATRCREAGMPMDVLSKLLTHRSEATTSDIYSHLSPEFMRNELSTRGLLGDIRRSPQPGTNNGDRS